MLCTLLCMLEGVGGGLLAGGVGGAGDAGSDAPCAALYAGECGGELCSLEVMR